MHQAPLLSLSLPLPAGAQVSVALGAPQLEQRCAARACLHRAVVSQDAVEVPLAGQGQAPRLNYAAWCPHHRTPPTLLPPRCDPLKGHHQYRHPIFPRTPVPLLLRPHHHHPPSPPSPATIPPLRSPKIARATIHRNITVLS
jgi:hypothetical protein